MNVLKRSDAATKGMGDGGGQDRLDRFNRLNDVDGLDGLGGLDGLDDLGRLDGTGAAFRVIAPKILYFGTPVVLISSCNADGSANLAPMSSAWALGHTIMLGLGAAGKTAANLARTGECVLNLPSDALWQAVERLAPLTGKDPVPAYKVASGIHFEREKFLAAGLTALPSDLVSPPRVAECPLQLEARVRDMRSLGGEDADALAVEVEVVRVHARAGLIRGERHINPALWRPLIYNFRHYFGLGGELGKSFRSET